MVFAQFGRLHSDVLTEKWRGQRGVFPWPGSAHAAIDPTGSAILPGYLMIYEFINSLGWQVRSGEMTVAFQFLTKRNDSHSKELVQVHY